MFLLRPKLTNLSNGRIADLMKDECRGTKQSDLSTCLFLWMASPLNNRSIQSEMKKPTDLLEEPLRFSAGVLIRQLFDCFSLALCVDCLVVLCPISASISLANNRKPTKSSPPLPYSKPFASQDNNKIKGCKQDLLGRE